MNLDLANNVRSKQEKHFAAVKVSMEIERCILKLEGRLRMLEDPEFLHDSYGNFYNIAREIPRQVIGSVLRQMQDKHDRGEFIDKPAAYFDTAVKAAARG